jgi:hypothetical protein
MKIILAAMVLAAAASAVGTARSGPAKHVTCVDAWPEARYRNYGYDHIVHLINRCDVRMSCQVATNVNPSATPVALAPGEKREVLTFRGSPAREFTPTARCQAAAARRRSD